MTSALYEKNLESSISSVRHEIPPEPQFFSSPDNFIEFALDSMLGLVEAHAGSLMLWDEEQKALVLRAARGPYRERSRDAHSRLREGIAGWVGDQGRSVLVKDIQADDRFNAIPRVGAYATYSFISVPLISSNKLLGVVNITERANLVPFIEEDLVRARLLAQHIAIAYDNMRGLLKTRDENFRLHDRLTVVEQTLKRQEPLVSIGKLASNLAHELNNPLDSIRRYVNLALDQVMEDSLAREYILKSKEGVRRAIQVIRGLLQFSRQSAKMELKEVELLQVLSQSLDFVSRDANFEGLTVETPPAGNSVIVPDCGLYVVFRNLMKNAHHAMQGSGKLGISLEVHDSMVTVRISDTGCGIPEAIQPRVFEPFFSTKQGEGTGIGLAISREIVEKCGGSISFESRTHEGTVFIVKLPVIRRIPQSL